MPRGKRRHAAPPGYMTSTEAVQKLGKMLYKHVKEGRVRKITPEGFKQGFYHTGDVEAILATEQVFSQPYQSGQWRDHPSSTFRRATDEDMPAIVEISRAIFGDPTYPSELRLIWLHKNPDTFYVLRNQEGQITGYTSVLPMRRVLIDQFIRDEIEGEDITADDIETFTPGKTIHLYIMSIGIDPSLSNREKHEYGARLVSGLFTFLLDLAQQGIEIITITARSYKPDGIRLLRKLGFPQLRSPVPGKNLYGITLAESGFSLFVQYSEVLNQWKREHAGTPTSTIKSEPRRPRTPQPATSSSSSELSELPPGTITLVQMALILGINRTTLLGHIKNEANGIEHIALEKPNRPNEFSRYFAPDQAQALKEWHAVNSKKSGPLVTE